MPTYDYLCKDCGKEMTVFHSMKTPYTGSCAYCASTSLQQVIRSCNVVIPPQHQSSGSKFKYYGITNPVTGEGITKDTDVRQPPGLMGVD